MNLNNYPRIFLALPNGVKRKMYIMKSGIVGWNVHVPSGSYSIKGTQDGQKWIPSEKAKPIYEEWAQLYLQRKLLPKNRVEYYFDNVMMPNGKIKRCRIYTRTKHSFHKPLSGQFSYTHNGKRKNIQGKIINRDFSPNYQFLYNEWLESQSLEAAT